MSDPIVERLDDALQRVRDLELRALAGEHISNAAIITETRAIRDDILAERRDRMDRDAAIHARIDGSLPRQPWARIGTAFIAIFSTVIGGMVLLLITRGLER